MKKYLLTIIAVIMMTLSMKAQGGGQCGDNLTYYFDEDKGTLTISGTGDMWDYPHFDYPSINSNTSLKHLVIEEGVTSIGAESFMFQIYLQDISMPNTLISIGYRAFYASVALSSVEIPNSVTTIGKEAFRANDIESLTLGNSVSYIGELAFAENHHLKHITIPNSLKTIQVGTFYNCKNLESVDFGNSLVSIDMVAFQDCSLTTISLPETLLSIGDVAFSGNNFVSIFIGAITPPECNETNFDQNTYEQATLFVPIGCKSLYENADTWKNFVNIVESGEFTNKNEMTDISLYPNPARDHIKISSMNGHPSVVKIYNAHGILVNEYEMNSSEIDINISDYKRGIYFIDVEGVMNKVVVK